jgi:hypothetical protein
VRIHANPTFRAIRFKQQANAQVPHRVRNHGARIKTVTHRFGGTPRPGLKIFRLAMVGSRPTLQDRLNERVVRATKRSSPESTRACCWPGYPRGQENKLIGIASAAWASPRLQSASGPRGTPASDAISAHPWRCLKARFPRGRRQSSRSVTLSRAASLGTGTPPGHRCGA